MLPVALLQVSYVSRGTSPDSSCCRIVFAHGTYMIARVYTTQHTTQTPTQHLDTLARSPATPKLSNRDARLPTYLPTYRRDPAVPRPQILGQVYLPTYLPTSISCQSIDPRAASRKPTLATRTHYRVPRPHGGLRTLCLSTSSVKPRELWLLFWRSACLVLP
ncbi:hypothetical protein LX32DRAFT_415194 [Colletotrichum zoysiae]|uniref:Uncharacterized protein n=1 Tax=Colletotrichum zoysiae TaxID=1216348 RepID=A0AAD9M0Z7_9PEZI|nr:hypothetical protein LX32DRAFT_415194 [Colletotrichum zoysiae]